MKKKDKKTKVKRERKHISNTDKFMLVFLAMLIVYLAIILPIRLCVVSFSWHWFVFGLIAVIVPFAFINLQLDIQKKLVLTCEQKKNVSIVTVKYILYFWFLDCLYMTIFNQWYIWIYILGIITLIKVFYSLSITFLGKKQKNVVFDISLLFDFLLGIGLTVYLIYLITDTNLQTIITAIVAAVYGGLLTLVGVAWTIRKGDKDRKDDLERREIERKEEERKKFIPYIKVSKGIIPFAMVDANARKTVNLDNDESTKKYFYSYTIESFNVKNISHSNIILKGIIINEKYFEFSNDTLFEKDTVCQIQITRNFAYSSWCALEKLILIAEDILGNKYQFDCIYCHQPKDIFEVETDSNEKYTSFNSNYIVESISLPKRIKEATND